MKNSILSFYLFQKRQEEGKVKVFCFCDALWSLGDDNSFYPFRLKCQYDNSLQEENVHFFNIQHSSTTFDNRVPNFYISYAFLGKVFCSLNFIKKAVSVSIGKLAYNDITKSEISSCLPLFSVSKKALQDSKKHSKPCFLKAFFLRRQTGRIFKIYFHCTVVQPLAARNSNNLSFTFLTICSGNFVPKLP